ncbi:MAG: DUF883 domain-containing protein [Chloroflexi bacterium]|nr:DUF883 domain-containing protein [Chloroflexota bacterium]
MNMSANEVSKEKLVSDVKVVVQDAEDLMRATAGDVGEKAKEARVRLGAALESAKASCRKLEEKAVAGAKATDQLIREHPYESIGIGFGIGLLVGLLISRK